MLFTLRSPKSESTDSNTEKIIVTTPGTLNVGTIFVARKTIIVIPRGKGHIYWLLSCMIT